MTLNGNRIKLKTKGKFKNWFLEFQLYGRFCVAWLFSEVAVGVADKVVAGGPATCTAHEYQRPRNLKTDLLPIWHINQAIHMFVALPECSQRVRPELDQFVLQSLDPSDFPLTGALPLRWSPGKAKHHSLQKDIGCAQCQHGKNKT